MATPANRVPVRIARGSKANLDTAIAAGDLKEGEICYATDENGIYIVEGGVLTQAGADLASTSIDALSDVDTTTVAPTDGQVLIWNNVDGEWQPGDSDVVSDTTPQLGGNLDVNGNYIVSASGGNVEIAPDTTGDLVVRGNDTDGSITLNCTANTHGVKIQSPPHSDAATYTLTLPSSAGIAGQVLTSQGGSQLTWENAASGGGSGILPFDAILKYTYGDAANPGEWQYWSNFGANDVYLNFVDNTGVDATDMFEYLDDSNSVTHIWHSGDNGATWTKRGGTFAAATSSYVFNSTTGEPFFSGDQWFSFADPTQPNRISSNADVDTYTTAPTDGQVLTWVDANSQWEPAAASGAVSSVNGQTGAVVLDLEDLNNVLDLAPAVYQFTGTSTASFPTQVGGEFYSTGGSSEAWFDDVDANGADFATVALTKVVGDKIWISTDGTNFTEQTIAVEDVVVNFGANKIRLSVTNGWPDSYNGGSLNDVYISWNDPGVTAPTDGQVLTWVDANSQWEPATPSGGSGTVARLDDVGDVKSYADTTVRGEWDTKDADNVVNEDSHWTAAVSGSNEWVQLSTLIDGVDHYTELDGLITGSPTIDVYNSADDSLLGSFAVVATDKNAGWQRIAFRATTGDTAFDAVDAHTGGIYIAINSTVWNASTTANISDGQVLTWVDANSQWEPVSLGVQDMDDFELNPGTPSGGDPYDTKSASQGPTGDGEWYYGYSTRGWLDFAPNDANGDAFNELVGLAGGSTFYLSKDGGAWVQYTLHSDGVTAGRRAYLAASYPSTEFDGVSAISVSATLPSTPPQPLADGDILQYVSADSKFKPTQLGIDDLSDVDTTTAAPTDGQVLAWVNANSQWEPSSLRTAAETRTLLGIGEYADDAAAGTGGVASGAMYYNTTSSDYRLKS